MNLSEILIIVWNKIKDLFAWVSLNILMLNSDLENEIIARETADISLQNDINAIKEFITYEATDEAAGLIYSQSNPDVFVYWKE